MTTVRNIRVLLREFLATAILYCYVGTAREGSTKGAMDPKGKGRVRGMVGAVVGMGGGRSRGWRCGDKVGAGEA